MKNFIKKYLYWIVLSIIVLIGVALRAKGFFINPSLWHDESGLAWNILNKSYLELFQKLRFLQVASPMFLISTKFLVFTLHVQDKFFFCDAVLRLIPFVCGILSIGAFYFVCDSIFKSKYTTLFAVALFALNPVLINYSFEFKPYIVDVFCTLITLWIFLNVDFQKDSLKKIFIYGGILAILPWFSFITSVVIFAGFMTLSYKKENPRLFTSLLAPVFVSVLVYLKVFILNIYTQNSQGMIGFWSNEFVKKDFSNLSQLNLENLHYFFMGVPLLSIGLVTLLMFVGLILLIKNKRYRFLTITTLTLSTIIVASMMYVYPFSRRLIIFLLPFLFIFIAEIMEVKNKWIASILMLCILIPHLLFAIDFAAMKNLNKGDFSREMMLQMLGNIRPNEVIIVNESSNADYFYYSSFFNVKNKMIYLKPQEKSPTALEDLLNAIPKGEYWFFMPNDYNIQKSEIKRIISWAEKNTKISTKAQATQSALLKLTID